jgi:hypothetical protein
MTISMQNSALTWTDPDGAAQASAVAYDKPSTEKRKAALEAAGSTDVRIVETKPGELPDPTA